MDEDADPSIVAVLFMLRPDESWSKMFRSSGSFRDSFTEEASVDALESGYWGFRNAEKSSKHLHHMRKRVDYYLFRLAYTVMVGAYTTRILVIFLFSVLRMCFRQ